MRFQIVWVALLLSIVACQKDDAAEPGAEGFESLPVAGTLQPGLIDEVSGIADSRENPGYLWVQQDGGNPGEIGLLSHEGSFLKSISLQGATNRDWEDMCLASGPVANTNYIYLADIGDNNLLAAEYFIYRFAEPPASATTVTNIERITFHYPDGAHDAEAMLVDNNTKDIYVITKRDEPSRIYKLAYPQSTSAINTATLAGSLSFSGATSAAIPPDGKQILIKTYSGIMQWTRNSGQTIEQSLATNAYPVGYQLEPQGEAMCFKNDDSGFFTLSERPSLIASVNLNFYKRK